MAKPKEPTGWPSHNFRIGRPWPTDRPVERASLSRWRLPASAHPGVCSLDLHHYSSPSTRPGVTSLLDLHFYSSPSARPGVTSRQGEVGGDWNQKVQSDKSSEQRLNLSGS